MLCLLVGVSIVLQCCVVSVFVLFVSPVVGMSWCVLLLSSVVKLGLLC